MKPENKVTPGMTGDRASSNSGAQFTPAPWHVAVRQLDHSDDFAYVRYCCDVAKNANETAIVRGIPIHGPYAATPALADATLVAAAPELYAALRAAIECDDGHDGQLCTKHFLQGKNALAKAEL